jgi:serine/threonine protein phosphatase PrpC
MTIDPKTAPRLRVTWHGQSVVGCVRSNNEDSLWASRLAPGGEALAPDAPVEDATSGWASLQRPGALLAAADGMGGAKAGEVASDMAVNIVGEEMAKRVESDLTDDAGEDDFTNLLVGAVEVANERIRDESASNPNRRGMGTTLTAVWAYDNLAQIAHVGDSRAYLFRKGNLEQITKDQSLVEKLLEDKIISPEEAERMAARNIILQALGSEEDLEVAHPSVALQDGDTLLLCTDGLTGVVSNGEVEETLRLGGSLEDLCARLIKSAEEKGGPDNITVLLCRIENEHRATG